MPITPPIFICSDDVYVFASKEEAESFLEPVDVEPNEQGFDAEGRLLRVVVRGEVKQGRWTIDQSHARVELVVAEEVPSHQDELRTRLLRWLARSGGEDSTLATASLEQLVERVARRSARKAGKRGPV